jgi:allophanate hydrolase
MPERDAEAVRGCDEPARSSSERPISTSSRQGSSAFAALSRAAVPAIRRSFRAAPAPGSAVAVARGIVAVALAPTRGRPGRPATLNNIVGLKPSVGSVPRVVSPACLTLDCVSVRVTVEDAWVAYDVLASYDAGDPFSRRMPAPHSSRGHHRTGWARQRRTKTPSRCGFGGRYQRSPDRLAELGATIVPLPFADFHAVGALLYEGAWVAERFGSDQRCD